MSSSFGSAAVHGNTVCFSQGRNVYSYAHLDNKWATLPACHYRDFSLAVVKDSLATVGGYDEMHQEATNNLKILTSDRKSWRSYSSMPTKRILPASVTATNMLIVAGGKTSKYDCNGVSAVEVLNISSKQWMLASSAPKTISSPQMTLCDGSVYLSSITTIFSCGLGELLKTAQLWDTLVAWGASREGTVWTRLAKIPLHHKMSLVTVSGSVFAIGSKQHSASVYSYMY